MPIRYIFDCQPFPYIMTIYIYIYISNHNTILNMLDTIGFTFSIIIITETLLNTNNIKLCNINEYNSIHTIRKNGRGGGVSIHIIDNIKYDIIDNLRYSNNICEIATIKIISNNSNIILSGIYRPPDALSLEFINTIQTIFDNFPNNNNIFFGGDFNINLFNHRNNALIKYFIDYIYSLNCRPLINKATRIENDDHSNSESLIDNIYCNLEPINKGIIYSDSSDNFPIFTSFILK